MFGGSRIAPVSESSMPLMRWRLLIAPWRTIEVPTGDFDGAPTTTTLEQGANSSARRLAEKLASGQLVRLLRKLPSLRTFDYYIVYPQDFDLPRKARACRDRVLEQARDALP